MLVDRGVRQGCALSPTLCNLHVHATFAVVEDTNVSEITVGGRNITSVRYADEISHC